MLQKKQPTLHALRLLILMVLMCGFRAYSQDKSRIINTLRLEVRADFSYEYNNDQTTTGFHGKALNVVAKGNISPKFSYNFRQRLNIADFSATSLFRGTDFLSLTYALNDHFSFTAGKDGIGMGGFECNIPPIDFLIPSAYWAHLGPGGNYQIGVSAMFTDHSKKHTLQLQVANSPYATESLQNLYSYNVLWRGKMGWFRTAYSVNFFEYEKERFVNYISLSNQFIFNHFEGIIDFSVRSRLDQFRDDFTELSYAYLMAKAKYHFNNHVALFVKGIINRNRLETISPEGEPLLGNLPVGVPDGNCFGIGCEYFPLKESQDIRVHACFSTSGDLTKQHRVDVGVTWRVDFAKWL